MEPENDELDSPQSTQSIDPVEPREPWDKREDESQKAFTAFTLFRDAEKRSFKIVADSLNCSPQNIFQWSSRFDWKGRCDSYDVWLDQQQRVELARSRVRMRERHLRLSLAMQGIAATALAEWNQRILQKRPLDLAPEQIAMLVKAAIELEHRTIGSESERGAVMINCYIGEHRYEDEKGEVHIIPAKPFEQFELEQWEKLSPEEKAAEAGWKDPPKKRSTN